MDTEVAMQNPIRKAAEALVNARDTGTMESEAEAFAALRAALALPAPEPRAWLVHPKADFEFSRRSNRNRAGRITPLYVEPPAPQTEAMLMSRLAECVHQLTQVREMYQAMIAAKSEG
jgi:hypothetical protein